MTMMATIGQGCDAAVDALHAEFGAVLAERIIEAEALDFLWEARVRERYLGRQLGLDLDDEDASLDLSRVAIVSVFGGRWYAATCVVDGDGAAVELLRKQSFGSREEAASAFMRAR